MNLQTEPVNREKTRPDNFEKFHSSDPKSLQATFANAKWYRNKCTDTLLGMVKGIVLGGSVNRSQFEGLHSWLIHNDYILSPVTAELFTVMDFIASEAEFTDLHAEHLYDVMVRLIGGYSLPEETAKPSITPFDTPLPPVEWDGKIFVFTGDFVYGSRQECIAITETMGGICIPAVTKKTHYLVVGDQGSMKWRHESFGTKIENAMITRAKKGVSLAIIPEWHWLNQIEASGAFE